MNKILTTLTRAVEGTPLVAALAEQDASEAHLRPDRLADRHSHRCSTVRLARKAGRLAPEQQERGSHT